jgi:N-methylhydantoinase A
MATCPGRLNSPAVYAAISEQFHRIESEGRKYLYTDGFEDDRIDVRRTADLRYVGQIHECTVELSLPEIVAGTGEAIKAAFHRRHEELYAYCEVDNEVEIVNIESTLIGRIERPAVASIKTHGLSPEAIKGHRMAIFSKEGERVETPVFDGPSIGCGVDIVGPAIIEEDTTTIVIEPGWTANLHPSGSYVIEARASER